MRYINQQEYTKSQIVKHNCDSYCQRIIASESLYTYCYCPLFYSTKRGVSSDFQMKMGISLNPIDYARKYVIEYKTLRITNYIKMPIVKMIFSTNKCILCTYQCSYLPCRSTTTAVKMLGELSCKQTRNSILEIVTIWMKINEM